MEVYGIDPCHYYSLPGYTFDAALKFTKINLKLIRDELIYGMIEDSIRGGLSFVGKRYVKANNPFMVDFDSKKTTTYNLYIDANNLYGSGMCEPLPLGNFTVLDIEKNFEEFSIFLLSCFLIFFLHTSRLLLFVVVYFY